MRGYCNGSIALYIGASCMEVGVENVGVKAIVAAAIKKSLIENIEKRNIIMNLLEEIGIKKKLIEEKIELKIHPPHW